MNEYIKGKGILVGTFNQDQIDKKIHETEIVKAIEKYGILFTNREYVYEGSQIVGIRYYLCHFEDMDFWRKWL